MNKRKLTSDEKSEKKKRKAAFMTIFINGRPKRVRRPPIIDGMPVEEFIARNADPLWLHRNGMWELMPVDSEAGTKEGFPSQSRLLPLNPLASDVAEINAPPPLQEKKNHGQGFDEVAF